MICTVHAELFHPGSGSQEKYRGSVKESEISDNSSLIMFLLIRINSLGFRLRRSRFTLSQACPQQKYHALIPIQAFRRNLRKIKIFI